MKNLNYFKAVKIILFSTYFLIPFIGSSQSDSASPNYIGVRLGFGPTNITTNVIDVHENDLGVSFGIAYEHLQKNKITWSIELQSEIKGYEGETIFWNDMGEEVKEDGYPIIVDYTYVGVPIKIGFLLGEKFYKFGNIGICPSYHASTMVTYPEIDINGFPGTNIVYYGYQELPFHRIDLSMLAELGLGYELSDRFHLYTSLRVEYSLTNLAKDYDTTVENPVARHYGFSINFGARFRLPGK